MKNHRPSNPITGLFLSRDGYWHISKTIDGRRLRKSTGTKDYRKAVKVFYALMHAPFKDGNEPYKRIPDSGMSKWAEEVSSITKTSWLGRMYKGAQGGARSRGITWALSFEEMVAIAIASEGVCAISGIPFSFDKENDQWSKSPFGPSIDRIDSKDHYHITNCRLV